MVTVLNPAEDFATIPQANVLDNGGFEIWQRGTSFTSPASATYTADRWRVQTTGAPAFTVTQESVNIDSGIFSLKLNITSVGGATQLALRQVIENGQGYDGKPLAFSCRVKCSVPGACNIAIADDNGSVVSSTNVGTGWETLTVKLASPIVTSTLNVYVGFAPGGNTPVISTIYMDSAMLVIGSQPVTFIPTNAQVDLARCQRYYWQAGGNISGEGICQGFVSQSSNCQGVLRFPVQMRAAPTATVVGVSGFFAYSGTSPVTPSAAIMNDITPVSAVFSFTVSGMTAGQGTQLMSGATTSYIQLSADL
jgi:hypothetical protein